MKLISLNVWGGKIYKPLLEFIQQNSQNIDVFCFQEVFKTSSDKKEEAGFRLNLFQKLSSILENHKGYLAPCVDNYIAGNFQPNFINFNLSWGQAIFIRKKIKIEAQGDFFVFGERGSFDPKDMNSLPRNVQYITFKFKGKKFTVCNLHGIWVKGTKDDTLSRIKQSEKIKRFLDKQTGGKILCGDFNLNINTSSLDILEENLENLIKKNKISTTRNKFFPGNEKYADYIFVSNNVIVKSFQVPNLEISDHLPMILDFS